MTPEELRSRTKSFALRVVEPLPFTAPHGRCSGYRQAASAMRDVSGGELSSLLQSAVASGVRSTDWKVVVEEADETGFWLEMLGDAEIMKVPLLEDLLKESRELTAIFTATLTSTRRSSTRA